MTRPAYLEFEDTAVGSQLHTFIYRHHDLNTHESLVFDLDADLDGLLKCSTEENEMLGVISEAVSSDPSV